ncbi:hypothetical protein JRC04_05020 [Mycolicibacterium sp. S2-37]|uniref:hypothetical protein n=1 Tax=Mycolicibacterium sp. S2-37 TaxID=2810297 RepID=UPI001A944CF1|nr:hypothetical protein [Mycolicibacterium sp. S2-37]MBO0676819.1 hypothetical protein [Mycolicibacterium sp. S2-37]
MMNGTDVWMLSRYDGKGLYALAFPSSEALVDYVIDYYGGNGDLIIEPPKDGDDLDAWLAPIESDYGIELSIDHDVMAEAPEGATTHDPHEHVEKIATEAGYAVMGRSGILGILVDRETVSAQRILALTDDDVDRLYDSFVGPAVDGIEDELLGGSR